MVGVAAHAINECMANEGIQSTLELDFVSEIDPQKQKWGLDVTTNLGWTDCCVHGDITKICGGASTCLRHKQHCVVPNTLDVLVSGFSCKDLSKTNPNRNATVLSSQTQSAGRSADTYHGTLQVIDQTMPEFIVLENVELNDESGQQAIDTVLHSLATRGYDAKAYVIDCADYGLPQARVRTYFFGVLSPARSMKIESYSEFFARFEVLLNAFKMPCPDLVDVLLREECCSFSCPCGPALARSARGVEVPVE